MSEVSDAVKLTLGLIALGGAFLGWLVWGRELREFDRQLRRVLKFVDTLEDEYIRLSDEDAPEALSSLIDDEDLKQLERYNGDLASTISLSWRRRGAMRRCSYVLARLRRKAESSDCTAEFLKKELMFLGVALRGADRKLLRS